MKFLKWVGIFIGGFILLGVVIGTLSDGPKTSPQTPTTTATAKKSNLELVESSVQKEQYVRYVVGTVKNNSTKQYSYVQVEINLYDNSDAQVGSTLANANNLEPGATWKFKAPILEDNATKYKVKDVTGY